MKKLLLSVLIITLLGVLLSGCVKGNTNANSNSNIDSIQNNSQPTNSDIDSDFDPIKEVVTNFFTDFDGYWLNAKGEYALFKIDGDKCIFEKYTDQDKLILSKVVKEITATNKTTYALAFEDDSKIAIEIAESYDNILGIHDVDTIESIKFVFSGKTYDQMQENYSRATNRAAS